MTDNEIIKAWECCNKLNHNEWSANQKICKEECPYKANCYDEENNINMTTDAIDLINRQKAEIEELTKLLRSRHRVIELLEGRIISLPDEVRAEAIKDFAERLNKEAEKVCIDQDGDFVEADNEIYDTVADWCKETSDNLVKEMVGEDK